MKNYYSSTIQVPIKKKFYSEMKFSDPKKKSEFALIIFNKSYRKKERKKKINIYQVLTSLFSAVVSLVI